MGVASRQPRKGRDSLQCLPDSPHAVNLSMMQVEGGISRRSEDIRFVSCYTIMARSVAANIGFARVTLKLKLEVSDVVVCGQDLCAKYISLLRQVCLLAIGRAALTHY